MEHTERRRYASYAPAILLGGLGFALLYRAWGRVGDVLVDFGRELYVPWQIADGGRVLYRDLAYLYGPLSPYVNALWWLVFGGGDRAVLIGNVFVLAACCALLYRILAAASDRYAATAGVATFLVCGAFASTLRLTNYNFLTPYAHGMTHGLALGFGAVAAAVALYRDRRAWRAAVLGLCVGLALLTKPELALAVALAGVVGLIAATRDRRHLGAFAAAAVAPALVALLLLWSAMPLSTAVDGLLGGWQHAGKPYVTDTPFYRFGMGLEFVRRNAEKVVRYACLYAQFLLALALAAVIGRAWLCGHRRIALAISMAVACGLFALAVLYPYRAKFWEDVGRGLPLFPIVGVVTGFAMFRRRPSARAVAVLTFSVLAGTLLLKMGLNARLIHYGFVLGVPAAVLGVVIATGLLPEAVARVGGYGPLVRAGGTALTLAVCTWQLRHSSIVLADRVPLGLSPPASTLAVGGRDASLVSAVLAVRRLSTASETLAVFPDGSGVNFATQRRNPTPYDICHPMTLAMYGEDRVTEAYRTRPPTLILMVRQNTRMFGSRWFGQTYATGLAAILADYDKVASFDGRMDLYRRRIPPSDLTRLPRPAFTALSNTTDPQKNPHRDP